MCLVILEALRNGNSVDRYTDRLVCESASPIKRVQPTSGAAPHGVPWAAGAADALERWRYRPWSRI